jgi:hypothetical protein
MNKTDLTFMEKLNRAQVNTCSACPVYKKLKKEDKRQKHDS